MVKGQGVSAPLPHNFTTLGLGINRRDGMEIRSGEGITKGLVKFLPEDTMVPLYVLFNGEGEPTKYWEMPGLPEKWLPTAMTTMPIQLPIARERIEALKARMARRVVTYGPLR